MTIIVMTGATSLTGERGYYELASGSDARHTFAGWKASPLRLISFPSRSGTKTTARSSISSVGVRPVRLCHYYGRTPNISSSFARFARDKCLICSRSRGSLHPEQERPSQRSGLVYSASVWIVQRGRTLRIPLRERIRVRSSLDNWATTTDTHSTSTTLGIDYCDIVIPDNQRVSVRFTLSGRSRAAGKAAIFEVACNGTRRRGVVMTYRPLSLSSTTSPQSDKKGYTMDIPQSDAFVFFGATGDLAFRRSSRHFRP